VMELIYARMCPTALPRYTIRNTGLTRYGEEGPRALYGWDRSRVLRIEHDRRHPEFSSLVLSEARRFKWLRHASRVEVPLPSRDYVQSGEPLDETNVVAALHAATHDFGLAWTTCKDGTIVLTKQ
jgi:hypothetical protein